MKRRLHLLLCGLLFVVVSMQGQTVVTKSMYETRPDDADAYYFTPENYDFRPDGKSDLSDALQRAINQVKIERNFGVLFIPEGKYRISKTIYIPPAIRLIGYGKNRPEFILILFPEPVQELSLAFFMPMDTNLKKFSNS